MTEPAHTLHSLCKRPPVTVRPDTCLLDALRFLSQPCSGGAMIAEDGAPLGVVSLRQILYAAGRGGWASRPIADLIEHPPIRISRTMTWRAAGQILCGRPREYLLICDPPEAVTGLLGKRDLLRHLPVAVPVGNLRAARILESCPPRLSAKVPLAAALMAMETATSGCILIGTAKRIEGLVTLSDIRALLLAGHDPRRTRLREIRWRSPAGLPADLTLAAALARLRRPGDTELVVCDDRGQPLGRVTRQGLLAVLLADEAPRPDSAPGPPARPTQVSTHAPSCDAACPGAGSRRTRQDNLLPACAGRERALNALESSEARFRSIFEQAPLGMALLDLKGRLLITNPALSRMLGYSADELLQTTLAALTHPEDRDHDRALWCELIAGQCPSLAMERRFGHQDGRLLWAELTLSAVPDCAGQVVAAVAMVADITARKTAEQRLRQSAVVFETTREGVLITDTERRIVAVNRAFCEITGYSEAEVLGRNPRLLQSGRHDAEFYRVMWQAIATQGRWRGEIWNRRRNGEIYPQWVTISHVLDDRGTPTHFIAVFADLTASQGSQAAADYLTHHDALTGLPNRLLFDARLGHALRRATHETGRLAVLILNLDRFQHVNDCLGHHLGDDLLREMARRLRPRLSRQTSAARLTGGEFVFLCEDLKSPEEAGFLAADLTRALRMPFVIDDHELFVTASIGVSLYPEDGQSVAELSRNARAALFQAKERGGNGYQFFSPGLTRAARERLTLEAQLHRALERREFVLHFQPQVELETGHWIGAEALIRWHHPDLGLLPPQRFIQLAEASGLILPIGNWVLQSACAQGRAWLDAGLDPGVIAVNIAAAQLVRGDLVTSVTEALARSGLPAGRLAIEVTEDLLLEHRNEARRVLDVLGQLGVRVAIDDFGAGFSSLTLLRRLPVQSLKIDRSFIQHLPDADQDLSLVQAVIAVAQALGVETVAVGVTSEAQRLLLLTAGCMRGQGRRFAAAQPAEDLIPGSHCL